MNYEVTLRKGCDGHRAETLIELPGIVAKGNEGVTARPGRAMLTICTSKRNAGGLYSSATVSHHGEDGTTTTVLFGDYSKTLAREAGRCTEKNIRDLHGRALALVPAILNEVAAFYAPKQVVA